MREFVAGRFDVLLATTIIENGLDIANVNTMIVNRADTMGLSQLYQLRGRVGRSSEQAYAWFLTPPFAQVGDVGLKRLRALEQYTELGSGFQIAMRDLEIRGAGNILGESQHGFIAAVGFELYCRLLKEAMDEVQGVTPIKPASDVRIDADGEALIPTVYVADGATRLSLYQELSSVDTQTEIDVMQQSMADRFGPLPTSVVSLLSVMRIKLIARAVGSTGVTVKGGTLTIQFEGTQEVVKDTVKKVFDSDDRTFELAYDGSLVKMTTALASSVPLEMLAETHTLFERIACGGVQKVA